MLSIGDLQLLPGQAVAVAVSALLVGVTKTGIPGLGNVVAPIMASVMPARASTGALLPMLLAADLVAVLYFRRHAVWSHLIRLLPWNLAGVVGGFFFLRAVDDAELSRVIGVIVLTLLAISFGRELVDARRRAQHGATVAEQREQRASTATRRARWYAPPFGVAAGFTTMVSNAAGPIMIIYLLAMGLPKREFMGTGAWYYLLINAIKIPFSAALGLITASSLLLNLAALPVILAGAWLGVAILKRLTEPVFVRVVQVMAVAAAVNLLL